MKPLYLLYIVLLTMLFPAALAASSSDYYGGYGSTIDMWNVGFYKADYQNYGFDSLSFATLARGNYGQYNPLVIGNIDDDPETEIVDASNQGIRIYEYDLETGSFIQSYEDLSYSVHSPVVLYDADDDGVNDIYFCGIDTSVGNSSFFSLHAENASLHVLWQRQIADGVSLPDTNPSVGCFLQASGTDNASRYSPVCSEIGGTDYCFFVGALDRVSGANTRASSSFTVYRFNAETGSETKYEPTADTFSEVNSLGALTSAVYGFGAVSLSFGDPNNLQGVPMQTPLCDVDSDGTRELVIPNMYFNTGPVYSVGMLVVDTASMGSENNWNSDGMKSLYSDETLSMTSPLCLFDGSGYNPIYGQETSTNTWKIRKEYSTISNYLEKSLGSDVSITGNEITNLWVGSYTDDGTPGSDVCMLANNDGTTEMEFGCADYSADLTANGFEQVIGYSGARNLFPNIVADLYGADYDLAGTTDDDVMTNFGIFYGSGVSEAFAEASFSPGYTASSTCSMADINNDGFADVACVSSSTVNLYTSQEINNNTDLILIVPDVGGATMCPGNQSFQAPAPPTGYIDEEEDSVRLVVDCTNDGSFDVNGSFVTYGNPVYASCYYNSTSTNNAKICIQDSSHVSIYTECLFYITQVNAVPGCEDPDGVFDSGDAVLDDETPPGEVPGQISSDFESDAETILTWMGGTSQNSRDIILISLIGFVMIMIAAQVKENGAIISIVVGGLALSVVTILGWIRPVYLVVVIVLAVFSLVVIRPLLSRGG